MHICRTYGYDATPFMRRVLCDIDLLIWSKIADSTRIWGSVNHDGCYIPYQDMYNHGHDDYSVFNIPAEPVGNTPRYFPPPAAESVIDTADGENLDEVSSRDEVKVKVTGSDKNSDKYVHSDVYVYRNITYFDNITLSDPTYKTNFAATIANRYPILAGGELAQMYRPDHPRYDLFFLSNGFVTVEGRITGNFMVANTAFLSSTNAEVWTQLGCGNDAPYYKYNKLGRDLEGVCMVNIPALICHQMLIDNDHQIPSSQKLPSRLIWDRYQLRSHASQDIPDMNEVWLSVSESFYEEMMISYERKPLPWEEQGGDVLVWQAMLEGLRSAYASFPTSMEEDEANMDAGASEMCCEL